MARVIFLTHADVQIDPAVPVPQWGLSDRGRARHEAFNATLAAYDVTSIWSSDEQKARDGAAIHAAARQLVPQDVPELGENDRSATGYLPPEEFQAMADAFFATPEVSVRGWERAVDAQARFAGAVNQIIATAPPGDVLIVAHGGVCALMLCQVMGIAITREHDQPGPKGGCWYMIDRDTRQLAHGWRVI